MIDVDFSLFEFKTSIFQMIGRIYSNNWPIDWQSFTISVFLCRLTVIVIISMSMSMSMSRKLVNYICKFMQGNCLSLQDYFHKEVALSQIKKDNYYKKLDTENKFYFDL